ncbi:hypothetical protein HALA3H3_940030 [Halomonas sp. A3H3]|nr:hypothetical protein HALA3H3_940030 [Halomonas sp. A3H3]
MSFILLVVGYVPEKINANRSNTQLVFSGAVLAARYSVTESRRAEQAFLCLAWMVASGSAGQWHADGK